MQPAPAPAPVEEPAQSAIQLKIDTEYKAVK